MAGIAGQISATGNYSLRVDVPRGLELALLGTGFNNVLAAVEQRERQRNEAEAALRASEAQLRQSQKMEAIGQLAGGVAHDFNNMLTAILSYARMLSDDLPAENPMRLDLEQIVAAGERAAGLTRQLLAFSRQQVIQPHLLELGQVVRGVEGMLRRVIGEDVDLRVKIATDISPVLGDAGQIEQVLLNLVVNARDAMRTGGTLTVEVDEVDLSVPLTATIGTLAPDRYVRLLVADTGVGMPSTTLAHLFEPFFTTKPLGHGTGLGLATVFGAVKQMGGDILVHSRVGEGSQFEIYLPRSAASPLSSAPPVPAVQVGTGGHETVLLVEDESLVRETARRILAGSGYIVLEASSGTEALSVAAACQGPVALLLTDVVMPGMTGRELAQELAVVRPATKVLYMSGYMADVMGRHGVLEAGIDLVTKPFTPETLRQKVHEVLDRPLPAAQSPVVARTEPLRPKGEA